MYQGGIREITLYENKGISFNYFDSQNERNITDLSGQGAIILVENFQLPELGGIKKEVGRSGRLISDYEIKFYLLGNNQENDNVIEQLHDSIYGWCALVRYYDETFKFYNVPFFLEPTEANFQQEASFEVSLKPRTQTAVVYLDYTEGVSTIVTYRADTTLITADNTIYTADYAL